MKPKLILMDEPFASLDAIVRARMVKDVVALVERESISVLLVTHDLEEAISLSDDVYLLSQGPRARITQQYPVPIPRPRDPVHSRMHPAFAPLYERLWADLSREVDSIAWLRRPNDDARSPLGHGYASSPHSRSCSRSGRRPAAPACSIRCMCRAQAGSAQRSV